MRRPARASLPDAPSPVYSFEVSPFVVAAALTLAIGACAPSAAKDFADDRRAMLATVAAHARQGPAPIG